MSERKKKPRTPAASPAAPDANSVRASEFVVIEPVAVRLPTAGRMLDCGTTKIHELIKAGKLRTIDALGDRRVVVESIKALVAAGKQAAA